MMYIWGSIVGVSQGILEYLDYRSSWLLRSRGGVRLRNRVSTQHSRWDDGPELNPRP